MCPDFNILLYLMSNRKRILFLSIIFLFALAGVIINLPLSVSEVFARTQTPKPPDKKRKEREALAKTPAPSGTLKDRLDKDDGYGIALFISSSIHGSLEVCGCPIHPLGGVARRAGYINAFRKRSPDAAIIQVDAGYIFSDDANAAKDGLREDARLMNEWIVRANELMNLDIVNLSYRDLPFASSLLKPDVQRRSEKSALISANIKPVDGTRIAPKPYIIKLVTGARLPKSVRIAFIGLSDYVPDNLKDAVARSGFVIEDPLAAAKAALAEVRDKADVTVVVGFLSMPMVNKLARQNDDLDLIIATDERGLVLDPKQVNNALIVYAAKETKHLAELRFYTDAEGLIDRFTSRYIELDEIIPDDPQMAAITKEARKEIDAAQRRVAEEEAKAILAKDPASPYALSETCGKCHIAEYDVWQKTLHSHAFAALETKNRTFDTACVGCHSLGFQKDGFVNIKATPQFANVHCESCHGPGLQHAAEPTAGNYKTPPKNESCLVCHDRENSPDFDFKKYWPVIAHTNSLKPPAVTEIEGKKRTRKGRKR
jgi:2',3'-cyclic-nucleotide 2'-phosphodiesterase (5'-nucleotidase family)